MRLNQLVIVGTLAIACTAARQPVPRQFGDIAGSATVAADPQATLSNSFDQTTINELTNFDGGSTTTTTAFSDTPTTSADVTTTPTTTDPTNSAFADTTSLTSSETSLTELVPTTTDTELSPTSEMLSTTDLVTTTSDVPPSPTTSLLTDTDSTTTTIQTSSSGTSSSISSSSSATASPKNHSSGLTGSARTWVIAASVVGGVAALVAALFVYLRCCRSRFDDLDDEEEIKWPELPVGRPSEEEDPFQDTSAGSPKMYDSYNMSQIYGTYDTGYNSVVHGTPPIYSDSYHTPYTDAPVQEPYTTHPVHDYPSYSDSYSPQPEYDPSYETYPSASYYTPEPASHSSYPSQNDALVHTSSSQQQPYVDSRTPGGNNFY